MMTINSTVWHEKKIDHPMDDFIWAQWGGIKTQTPHHNPTAIFHGMGT